MSPIVLRVAELRRARGWSQNALARRSSVPQSTISRIESGEYREWTSSVLERLAAALEVNPGDLLLKLTDREASTWHARQLARADVEMEAARPARQARRRKTK